MKTLFDTVLKWFAGSASASDAKPAREVSNDPERRLTELVASGRVLFLP